MLKLMEKIRKALTKPEVSIAYLFGSRARGTERKDSDYDIAVLFQNENVTILDEAKLAKELASALEIPVDKVNVVALNRADARLKARVLKEGIPVYYKSEEEKRRWELETYLNVLKSRDLDSIYLTRALRKCRGKEKE
jgi:predicted nucleotidyltransferase